MSGNFESFCTKLNATVVSEINSWSDDPELKKMLFVLKSIKKPQLFLDHYAEAMVARYLLKSGFQLNVEHPTVNGKHADFKAYKGDLSLFIHIKRLNTSGEMQKQINIQSQLETLKSIKKPFTVSILFHHDLTNQEMRYFSNSVSKFIKGASVGDATEIVDGNLGSLGNCVIYDTNNRGHILLVQTSPVKCIDDKGRFYDKLSDAYHQFMPKAINLIFVTSPWPDDSEDFESALLGDTYEDYTVIPPKKGRKNNGFWSDNKHPDSYIAFWFNFGLRNDYINFKTWGREGYKVSEFITNLFKGNF